MKLWAAFLVLILGSIAMAEDQKPRWSTTSPNISITNSDSFVMCSEGPDGVKIDWQVVEDVAAGKHKTDKSGVLLVTAKVLLAVRDGTWKPMR